MVSGCTFVDECPLIKVIILITEVIKLLDYYRGLCTLLKVQGVLDLRR